MIKVYYHLLVANEFEENEGDYMTEIPVAKITSIGDRLNKKGIDGVYKQTGAIHIYSHDWNFTQYTLRDGKYYEGPNEYTFFINKDLDTAEKIIKSAVKSCFFTQR